MREVEPVPSVLLALHLERIGDGPWIGAWLDGRGRHWAVLPWGPTEQRRATCGAAGRGDGMIWIDPSRLRVPASPSLVGVLAVAPRAGIVLELHLVRLGPGGPCFGIWLDDLGRRWSLAESARA